MVSSEKHEEILKDYLIELKSQGYKVLDLERKSPDGIAYKDGKLYAVEVLGRVHTKNKGWKKSWTNKSKQSIYHMFDGLLIKEFRYEKKD